MYLCDSDQIYIQMEIVTQKLFKLLSLITIFTLLIVSCSKDDDEPAEVKNYKHVGTVSADLAKGLLIALEQIELSAQVKYDVDLYTYKYQTGFRGQEITASGLICVPISSGMKFPVLSFQHGTMVAHSEAPSVGFNEYQNKSIEIVASLGYVVVMPDLIGFGESSEYLHPYMIKNHHVNAVTDMLNSMRDIPNGDLSGSGMNDSLFLMGYSQGGWSTMAVLNHLDVTDNHEWDLIATACGAGPYYLDEVKNFALSSETYSNPFYMAYVFECFADEGLIDDDLTLYYNEPYATNIPTMFDGSMSGGTINAALTSKNVDLYTPEFLTEYPEGDYAKLQQALLANSTDAWPTNANIFILHGNMDESIPYSVSDSIYNKFVGLGCENVQYTVIPGATHGSGALASIIASLEWFDTFKCQ